MLPIMIFELGTYGLAAGILTKYTKLPVILKLGITMLAGRMSYFIVYSIIKAFFLPAIPANLSVIGAIITGLPGIVLQLILITYMMGALNKGVKND